MASSYSTSKLVDGYKRAFVDSKVVADPMYSPQLLTNRGGQKVLTAIEKELKGCDDLFISVAFITMGGIAPLLGTLKDLEKKGVKGRILTTDYLMFSDPRALDKLNSLNNLDVRVFKTGENDVGFHTKGYMFHNNGDLRIIVGSSNLTQNAITKNHEWNTRMVSTSDGQFALDIEEEFNSLWDTSVCYSEYRDEYSAIYKNSKREREELGKLTRTLDLGYSQVLQPNPMQEQFILNIEEIIHKGGKRALLISATGTGKTYASAFALRKLFANNVFSNKKALFLSHREQINKQALKSYKRIFGKDVPMVLLSGNQNDIEIAKSGKFLFSTMNMIPIALSGDRSGNKDNIRRSLMEGNNIIKGASTIYFDEISRDRIYKSIDGAKLNNKRLLRKEYQDFKFKLGRIPFLKEFDDMGELDPLRLIDTWGSYQAFLLDSDDDYQVSLTKYQLNVLEFLSRKFASGMRIHELSLLDILINAPDTVDLWEIYLKDKHGIKMNDITRSSVFNVLEGKFFRGNAFKLKLVELQNNTPTLSEEFQNALLSEKFKEAVVELIRFGIYRYNKDYSNNYPGTSLNLYKKYTYSEVCWLLNWKAEEVSLNIGGYKFDTYSKTYPVFINYEKGDDVGATTRYEDRFNDQTTLTAISKSRRTLDSEDVINARNSKSRGILMPLFVRKNKDDQTSKEFYFLGTMEHNGIASEFIMPGTEGITAVEIGYKLNTPVENNLYEYITEQSL